MAVLNFLVGCNYYTVSTLHTPTPDQENSKLMELQEKDKYFILNCNDEAYHLSKLTFNMESMEIKCAFDSVPKIHKLYNPNKKSNHVYVIDNGEEVILNEVHIIVNKLFLSKDSHATIPISSIVKIDIINHDYQKSGQSKWLYGTVGVLAGLSLIAYFAISSISFNPGF